MRYDPQRHHRRSIRLRGYDYSRAGRYFVTICTYQRRRLFADAHFRQIAEEQWRALGHAGCRGAYGPRVRIDAFVVMPDHVHGIIVINGNRRPSDRRPDARRPPDRPIVARRPPFGAQQPTDPLWPEDLAAAAPLDGIVRDGAVRDGAVRDGAVRDGAVRTPSRRRGPPINVAPGTLGAIVRSYKAAVARRINARRRQVGAVVWQRNYWEKIIRNRRHLANVRRYIADNPRRHAERDRLKLLLGRMRRQA